MQPSSKFYRVVALWKPLVESIMVGVRYRWPREIVWARLQIVGATIKCTSFWRFLGGRGRTLFVVKFPHDRTAR